MSGKTYTLTAEIRTANPHDVGAYLSHHPGPWAVTKKVTGFTIMAQMSGESARLLNRRLLSALKRIEKRTTIQAEWKHNGTVWRFFAYVVKGNRRISICAPRRDSRGPYLPCRAELRTKYSNNQRIE